MEGSTLTASPAANMEAIAPAALVLTVSLDAVASLGLVLMSYDGPFSQAMLPRTHDTRLDIAAGLGDLLLATLLRGCLVMLPMLGLSATLPWLAVAATVVAAMTGWLTAKAVLLYQLADGKVFLVPGTGVTLHLPTVLAAEVLGAFMAVFLLVLVWVNRRVMMQPAAGDPIISLTRTAAALQQQRMAVQQWISQQEPAAGEEGGPELTAPLLDGAAAAAAAAAEAGQAGLADGLPGDDAASFVSARSRQLSAGSWATAAESLPSAASVSSSVVQPAGCS